MSDEPTPDDTASASEILGVDPLAKPDPDAEAKERVAEIQAEEEAKAAAGGEQASAVAGQPSTPAEGEAAASDDLSPVGDATPSEIHDNETATGGDMTLTTFPQTGDVTLPEGTPPTEVPWNEPVAEPDPVDPDAAQFTMTTPQPVYTREGGDVAVTAIAGQQWVRSPYETDEDVARPLFYFAHDSLGVAQARGNASGGIWYVWTGAVRVAQPV